MSKIKQKVQISGAEERVIRKEWDPERSGWQYSITDIMAILTESVDARNYWKALKNRLKTNYPQLVTNCNQLKMLASDGKYYLVDTGDADTILKIIQIIAPYNVPAFKSWFEHSDVQKRILPYQNLLHSSEIRPTEHSSYTLGGEELSTALEPSIDMYESAKEIVVQLILPGVAPEKIIIAINTTTLTIKGDRREPEMHSEKKYFLKELSWGMFYKKIELPTLIETDLVTAKEVRGLITITLPKLDQQKNRFIKIQSL